MIDRFIQKAITAAHLSDYYPHKLGCVAVYRKSVIAVGFNSKKTHPIQMEYNKFRNFGNKNDGKFHPDSLHAEIHCLAQLKHFDIDFSQVTLYIARVMRKGGYGMSRPCEACLGYMKKIGIRNIVYTTDVGIAEERLMF